MLVSFLGALSSSRMSRRIMLALTFDLVICEQKGEIGGEGRGKDWGEGSRNKASTLVLPLVQPPRYAISAEARGVYRRRGRAYREDEGREKGEEEAWYARAVVWMRGLRVRPQKRDEDRGYAAKQGVAQEGGYG